MNWSNEQPALDAAMTPSVHFEAYWRRASEAERRAKV
jgi:hypothetical protein